MSDKAKQSILQKPRQSVLAPQSTLGGAAEVVFVIDRSGSMSAIFEHVRNWIAEFVSGVASQGQGTALRYGFLCYNAQEFHRLEEYFSTASDRFIAAIKRIGASNVDEITLPAIDAAADFPWSPNGHRFLIVLTDEATATGYDPDWQRSSFDALKEKLIKLRIKLWLAAPDCPTFKQFNGIPHFEYRVIVGNDLENPAWLASFMKKTGSNVSQLSQSRIQATVEAPRDLYRIEEANVRLHVI